MKTLHVFLFCLTAFVIATEKFVFDAIHEQLRDDNIIEQVMRYRSQPPEGKPSLEITPTDRSGRL